MAEVESALLKISGASGAALVDAARRFKGMVRWSPGNRVEASRCGGLQSLTIQLGAAARKGNKGAVAHLADALAYLALDVRNKEVMVNDKVEAGGCDIYEVARLSLVQVQRQGSAGAGSQYAPAPSFAGADPVPLAALSRLIWNCSTIQSPFTSRKGT